MLNKHQSQKQNKYRSNLLNVAQSTLSFVLSFIILIFKIFAIVSSNRCIRIFIAFIFDIYLLHIFIYNLLITKLQNKMNHIQIVRYIALIPEIFITYISYLILKTRNSWLLPIHTTMYITIFFLLFFGFMEDLINMDAGSSLFHHWAITIFMHSIICLLLAPLIIYCILLETMYCSNKTINMLNKYKIQLHSKKYKIDKYSLNKSIIIRHKKIICQSSSKLRFYWFIYHAMSAPLYLAKYFRK
eukprot:307715_1